MTPENRAEREALPDRIGSLADAVEAIGARAGFVMLDAHDTTALVAALRQARKEILRLRQGKRMLRRQLREQP